MEAKKSYFSVRYDLIVRDKVVPYNLYVNASSVENKQKFVRIYPADEELTTDDLETFKKKYLQLYVCEDERNKYMKSLVQADNVSDE